MKRIRLERWTAQLQPPRNPRIYTQGCPFLGEARTPRRELQHRQHQAQHQWLGQRRGVASKRKASSAAAVQQVEDASEPASETLLDPGLSKDDGLTTAAHTPLYTPSHRKALHSAKLSALHARLSLPSKLPLQTLARCLVDPSADPRPGHNNSPLAVLGQDLLGHYTTEYLICHYPRLPMSVLFAAQYAYVGEATLGSVRAEWGVEIVAAPGAETDAGLLQVKRAVPGNSFVDGVQEGEGRRVKDMPGLRKLGNRLGTGRRNAEWSYRRGLSSRMVYDDEFGDLQTGMPEVDSQPYPGAATTTTSTSMEAAQLRTEQELSSQFSTAPSHPLQASTPEETEPTTVQSASASFVRAVTGALYLHAGAAAAKTFHSNHILCRHLKLDSLFHFTHPTRDLSRLCARENFEPPVARLISETGRLSRTPVFVVGVYSGENLLGEAAGASLNEARVRAAAQALKGWYLYSPPPNEIVLPSDADAKGTAWKPQMVDIGEIVT